MGKKNKPQFGIGNPNPKPNDEVRQKENTNRHVYIEAGAKIDFVQDLREQYKASHTASTAHNEKQLFWTKVASLLLLLTAGFSFWQVKIAKDTFAFTDRPYIGVSGTPIQYVVQTSDGVKTSEVFTKDAIAMNFQIEMKNFGSVAGLNFKPSWKVFVGEDQAGKAVLPFTPRTLYPTQSTSILAQIGNISFQRIIGPERRPLIFTLTIDYDGPNGHYRECQQDQFDPELLSFLNVGDCTR